MAKKILVIDDSRYTRLKIVQLLQEKGYEVLEAENGNAGLEKAREHNPDCIITDLLMPEMDGYQLLENLKKDNSTIPAIVITADIQETTREKVLAMGAIDVINKPADHIKLLELIQATVK
ncbi:PleD family two-component system response regulator [Thermodesulfobacteriota bacterium]